MLNWEQQYFLSYRCTSSSNLKLSLGRGTNGLKIDNTMNAENWLQKNFKSCYDDGGWDMKYDITIHANGSQNDFGCINTSLLANSML